MKRRPQPPRFITPLRPCNTPERRCPVSSAQASRRVLIMRAGAHGDILMGTPLLAALRQAWPDTHLTWIVEHTEQASIDANPYIDEVIVWDGSYWKKMLRRGLYPLWMARALAFRRELRRRRYDIYISFQPEEWPLLAEGVGASVRIGVFDTLRLMHPSRPVSRHFRHYTQTYSAADLPAHRTDQYLLALRALGIAPPAEKRMTMGYTKNDEAAVGEFLARAGLTPQDRLAVVAPMTTWPSRRWPGERYARVADALSRRGLRNVWIGSARENDEITQIVAQAETGQIVAAGALSFREVAALIARAEVLLSGDTGPMHVAAAVGTPYVALFGPTPIPVLAPLAGRGRALAHPVPCGPCYQTRCGQAGDEFMQCLRGISVASVLHAIEDVSREAVPTGAA